MLSLLGGGGEVAEVAVVLAPGGGLTVYALATEVGVARPSRGARGRVTVSGARVSFVYKMVHPIIRSTHSHTGCRDPPSSHSKDVVIGGRLALRTDELDAPLLLLQVPLGDGDEVVGDVPRAAHQREEVSA